MDKAQESAGKTTKSRNFRDLDVWKKGMEIAREVYRTTGAFPQKEQYGLANHMQRSAVSIPSNIAEGFNRYHNKEYRQFLYVALGSCAELETQIEIAADLRYVDDSRKSFLLERLDHESRMLRNLIKKLN
jgi:four helix bundle protein